MSIQFSDATNKSGLVELIDANTGSNSISYTIEDKTRDINLALDRIFSLIFSVGGTWQFDDSNHTDYPILTTNLISGQRDYSFVTDGAGNFVLDIYKVLVDDNNGNFIELLPTDQQTNAPSNYLDGENLTGIPTTYDKTANGIFLDAIPNYNATGGLKILINRTGSYFVKTDTTKKAGFNPLYHEYLALRPSYQYAYRKSLANANILKAEMNEMEQALIANYDSREKDTRKVFKGKYRSAR
jgi:hypothetical protein